MLTKRENPSLFAYIARELNKNRERKDRVNYDELGVISRAELLSLKSLTIGYSSDIEPLKNLKGISELANLESLVIKGVDSRNHRGVIAVHGSSWKEDEDLKNEDYKMINHSYNANQISDADFREIAKLTKLRKLNLDNQRKLTSVDLSSMPYLYEVSMNHCVELKTVSGLDKLICNNDPSKHPDDATVKFGNGSGDINYDFSGCDTLKFVPGLNKVISNHEEMGYWGNLVVLPVTTFAHICNQDKDFTSKVRGNETISWSEISEGGVKHTSGSNSIILLKNKTDKIIAECSSGENSPIGKVASVYRYICNNITYDHDAIAHEKKYGAEDYASKQKYKKMIGHEHSNLNRSADRARSAFNTLIDGDGVCVGVSNLFRFMLADLGFISYRCDCRSKINGKDVDPEAVISNHEMTRILIPDSSGKDWSYYCDPTWDLGKDISRYFILTKNEMVERGHLFTISNKDVENAMSLQASIVAGKFDRDRAGNKKQSAPSSYSA